ncbi:MAG: IPT/TIG domain-containing protein [Pseudonocardiaceae bacterium]
MSEPEGAIIMDISPSRGEITGNQTVTISGTNLALTEGVMFGDKEALNILSKSHEAVTCTTPPQKQGSVNVYVVDEDERQSNSMPFKYEIAPTPRMGVSIQGSV